MLKLLITARGITVDYTKYFDSSSLQVQEQSNIPTIATFNLKPVDARFVMPSRLSYVSLYSTLAQRSLYSGFINTTPVRSYTAMSSAAPAEAGGQLFTYGVSCTSDEYLLNMKAVPFIPDFYNRFQGDILTTIANILCPGYYNTSTIAPGDLVPYFRYDPTQSWCDIAKKFGDGSRYRYKARDKQLWYQPIGDQPLGIVYAEDWRAQGTFDPAALKTIPFAVPTVNDLTIIGDTEAGNNREDYFLGDGFTGNYPLLHQVFRGASTRLLTESWNEQQLNTQQWFDLDPGDNFSFNAGALNVVDSLPDPFQSGESYLSMNNGLEIAGGIDIQVGEVIFSDYCDGILGGLYADDNFTDDQFVCGFSITSPSGVVTSASGAAGVVIQPSVSGQLLGAPVVTRVNHNYVLQVVIHAPVYKRFNLTYRTLDGEQFGGGSDRTSGGISFYVQDWDISAATGIFYNPEVTRWSVDNVDLPAFAAMALINNHKLNVSVTNTQISTMPLGGLSAFTGASGLNQPLGLGPDGIPTGVGLILPLLPPGSGGYIGAASDVSGAASGNILLPPQLLDLVPTVLVLGNPSDYESVAQVVQGQSADTLAFYGGQNPKIPAAGTPIRFQSWQSQAAVARLQVSGDIADQADLVGDDGLRSAIVSNLQPLPRTSDDCANAALAFLQDRQGTFYNGSYSATNVAGCNFFRGTTSDVQYWPCVGRFLNVDAPRRGISKQKFLVTQLTVKILDMQSEYLQWDMQFGADLVLEKVLHNFVDLAPVSVLTPVDKAVPPIPFLTSQVTNAYLPDLNLTRIDLTTVASDSLNVQVLDAWGGLIEVRTLDTNWGRSQIGIVSPGALSDAAGGATPLTVYDWNAAYQTLTGLLGAPPEVLFPGNPVTTTYTVTVYLAALAANGLNTGTYQDRTLVGVFQGPVFQLPRNQVDQTWYMRPVTQPNNAFGVITSRRSKVLRIVWPLKPSVPIYVGQSNTVLQFNFNGDLRNIYGFELRATITRVTPGFPYPVGQQIVLVQKPVASYSDMTLDLLQTDFVSLAQAGNAEWDFQAYFFTASWQYSDALAVVASRPLGDGFVELIRVIDGSGQASVQIDLGKGLTQHVLLDAAQQVTILPPINSARPISAGDQFTLLADEPSGGGAVPPNFSLIVPGGFDTKVGQWQIAGTGLTRTTYIFQYVGDVWGLKAPPVTGGAISFAQGGLVLTLTEIDPDAGTIQGDGSYTGVNIFTNDDVSDVGPGATIVTAGNATAVLNAQYRVTVVFKGGTSLIKAVVTTAHVPAGTVFGLGGTGTIS